MLWGVLLLMMISQWEKTSTTTTTTTTIEPERKKHHAHERKHTFLVRFNTHVYSTIIWLIFCLRQHYLLLLSPSKIITTRTHSRRSASAFFTATFLFHFCMRQFFISILPLSYCACLYVYVYVWAILLH